MSNPGVARPIQTLAPQLRIFLKLQLALVLVCALAEALCAFVLRLTGIYTYPLYARSETAWDFISFATQFEYIHRPPFFLIREFPYPAPVAIPYAIFFSFQPHALRAFLCFSLATFVFAAYLLAQALQRRGLPVVSATVFVLASLLMSYPFWFGLKQANTEICVWVLVALGVWVFCKGRGYTAAACFGIAGSMKIFPFVYLGLLLTQRKYREMIFAGFTAVCTTLASLWLIGPNISQSWRYIEDCLAHFRVIYLLHLRPDEIGVDHTLFGIYKRFASHLLPPEQLGHIVNIYLAIAAVSGIVLYFVRIRHLPLINQVICLTIASILLPPISYDYTLIHLYIPWAMLVLLAQGPVTTSNNAPRKIPGLTAAFVCLAILASPESEFIHYGMRFGGQIKALVLVALMFIGLKYPFRSADGSFPKSQLPADLVAS